MRHLFSLLILSLVFGQTFAQDIDYSTAPLSSYPQDIRPPVVDAFEKSIPAMDNARRIAYQTPVRSQGRRGTCSIFSALGLLENRLRQRHGFGEELDLSEQYLEYLSVRGRTTDGSNSWTNFNNLAQYGVPYEKTLVYDSRDWTTQTSLGEERCGHLNSESNNYKSCLIIQRDPEQLFRRDEELLNESSTHFDPDFVTARSEASQFRNQYLRFQNYNYYVGNSSRIKSYLRSGYGLTMGMPIYYGAWNHGAGTSLGIEMNRDHWMKGIVGYPARGSVDRAKSPEKAAGHSVVIVGYDDERVVEVEMKMEDGSTKTFSYTGVYYFKNSWGTTSFGKDFTINETTYPGYGMVTQDYAHEYGTFYHLPL